MVQLPGMIDNLHVITYETLTNELTNADIAEGFDRALRETAGLNGEEEFDAIVHSTGMLVIPLPVKGPNKVCWFNQG